MNVVETLVEESDEPGMGPVDREIVRWLEDRIPHVTGLAPARGIAFRRCNGDGEKKIVYAGAYNEFRGRDVQFHAACDDPSVLTRSRIRLLFSYPFEYLGVERISCVIASSNARSRKVVEGLGWKQEGVIRRFYTGTEDGILYGILRDECIWL